MSVPIVTILSNGVAIDHSFILWHIDIIYEVNRIPYAQLILHDGGTTEEFKVSNSGFFNPGNEVEIKLRYHGETLDVTVFKGLVIKQNIQFEPHQSFITVELKDKVFQLTTTRKSHVFRDLSDSEIIEKLLKDAEMDIGDMPPTKPIHKEIVQYYCTDWDFAISRAEANGLWLIVSEGAAFLNEMGKVAGAVHQFSHNKEGNAIQSFEIEVDASQQFSKVESVSWDLKQQQLFAPEEAESFEFEQGKLSPQNIGSAVGAKSQRLTSVVPTEKAEIQAWANAQMAKNRIAMFKGTLTVGGQGDVYVADGLELDGIGNVFNGATIITGVRHRVNVQGWETDLQFGLGAEWFTEKESIRDIPAAGLLPAVNGIQLGVVDVQEEDPEKLYRVKVNIPSLGEKGEAIWARQAYPDAGPQRGVFFRPEEGDEVILGFLNDDPRQAVILGGLHNAKNPPPVEEISPDNFEKGIVSREGSKILFNDEDKAIQLETPGGNKIVINDAEKGIEMTDANGNSVKLSDSGIEIKSASDLIIEASGNITIKGSKVDIN